MNKKQSFLKHLAQTSDNPLALEIVNAKGIYLYDASGKKYMDLIAGKAVSNLGHKNSRVMDAVKQQLEKHSYVMVYGEYIQSAQVELAEKLASVLPSPLESCYFVNSGSEAIEGAMKLAKRFTGRSNIFSFKNAYHGSTQGAISLAGSEDFKKSVRPLLPGVKQFEYNNSAIIDAIDKNTAAVVLEMVQAAGGCIEIEKGFLAAVSEKCKSNGTLLVFDEIQTGFGRTGKLFAFEHYGIAPDILCLAKGMGGGFPLGTFISSKEIMDSLKSNPMLGHITTFGGHPVSCAASLETLNILLDNKKIISEVEKKGALFSKLLKHPAIKAFRNKGLMIGLEFESFEINKAIIDLCIEKGVIVDCYLFNDKCMRISPPLIINEEEIQMACTILLEAIEEVYKNKLD